MKKPILVIFAKEPVIGGAKTRLAADIGKVPAWRHHRAMTAKTLRHVSTFPKWESVLAITPPRALKKNYSAIRAQKLGRIAQGPGDLGARQARLFANFKGPVCVIGTDTPDISSDDISFAFKALQRCHAVIGPSPDGGYWLLALNTPVSKSVFGNIRWSSKNTCTDLIRNLSLHDYKKITYLGHLNDIDTAADLRQNKAH